ncbi:hypothetical protein EB118_02230 [bacterium]|nr:hypothetical protein [bacterium]NDC93929.1 hypothetical protein [bacterium]NDD83238.1 hypothetical protein [bacterium]NDG28906.1 hypothetical protein [bacterium]
MVWFVLAGLILLIALVVTGRETFINGRRSLACVQRQRVGPGPFVLNTLEKYFVFNPSIINHDNRILIVARLSSTAKCLTDTQHVFSSDAAVDTSTGVFHKDHKADASLLIKWYQDSPFAYVVLNNYTTDNNNARNLGMEDPRLFTFRGEVWVYAHYRAVRKGMFIHVPIIFRVSNPNDIMYLSLEGMSHIEKNWMPFEFNSELYFEYTVISPRVIIKCNIETGICERVYTEKVNIPYTRHIGGGAPPQRIPGGQFLGIAHTRENGNRPIRKNFFYTFSATPPFSITSVSPEFAVESESNNIEFASGLVVKDDTVIVSVGIQDCYGVLAYYKLQDILDFCTLNVHYI